MFIQVLFTLCANLINTLNALTGISLLMLLQAVLYQNVCLWKEGKVQCHGFHIVRRYNVVPINVRVWFFCHSQCI